MFGRLHLPVLARVISLILAASVPSTAHGQSATVPPFAQLLVDRLDRLAADTAVRRRTGAANGLALLNSTKPDALGRVSDAELTRLLGLVEQGLGTVDAVTCALAYGRSGVDGLPQAFIAIASKLDSAAAMPWVDAFMPLFRASIWDRPIGSRVSDAEARQALTAALAELSPENRARVQRAAARTGSDEDTCFFVRTTFASLLRVPGGRAAPILRTLMFGAGPATGKP